MVEYVFPVSSGWSLVILAMDLLVPDHQQRYALVAAVVVDIVALIRHSGMLAYSALLAADPAAQLGNLPSSLPCAQLVAVEQPVALRNSLAPLPSRPVAAAFLATPVVAVETSGLHPLVAALLAPVGNPLASLPSRLVATMPAAVAVAVRLPSSQLVAVEEPFAAASAAAHAKMPAVVVTIELAHQLGTRRARCIRQVQPTEVSLQPVQPSQAHHLGNHVRDHPLCTFSCNPLGLRLLPQVLFRF